MFLKPPPGPVKGETSENFLTDVALSKAVPIIRLNDTGGSGKEYGIRSSGGVLTLLLNTGTFSAPVWDPILTYTNGTGVISLQRTLSFVNAVHTHEDANQGGTIGVNAAEITTTNYNTAGYQGDNGITEIISLQPNGFWPPLLDPGDANRGNMTIDFYKAGGVDTTTRTIRFTADATGGGFFGASTISYQYWTASERPMVWISYEPDGTIQQIWEAEDPPDGEASRNIAPFSVAPGLTAVDITGLLGKRAFIATVKAKIANNTQTEIMTTLKQAYCKRGMYSDAQLAGFSDIEDLWGDAKLDDGQRTWRAQMWLRQAGQARSGRQTATIADILRTQYMYDSKSRSLRLK